MIKNPLFNGKLGVYNGITLYDDKITINQTRNTSFGKSDPQFNANEIKEWWRYKKLCGWGDTRQQAKEKLGDWWSQELDNKMFKLLTNGEKK